MAKQSNNPRATIDHYTVQAKKEGYPARSVYKLQEMDQKFGLIKKGMHLLDVGAAPGSWSLYALRRVGATGFVCGVDLKEVTLPPSPNCAFLKGDAFAPENLVAIGEHGPYDGLICDAAPSTTGNRLVDAGSSFELVWQVIELSPEVVKPGGFLVVKIFQGGDQKELSSQIKKYYKECKALKPQACRKDSFESYLVGIDLQDSKIGESNE